LLGGFCSTGSRAAEWFPLGRTLEKERDYYRGQWLTLERQIAVRLPQGELEREQRQREEQEVGRKLPMFHSLDIILIRGTWPALVCWGVQRSHQQQLGELRNMVSVLQAQVRLNMVVFDAIGRSLQCPNA
jgi:hypothetical protein